MSAERLLVFAGLYLAGAFAVTFLARRDADTSAELLEGWTDRQVELLCITLGLIWPLALSVELLKLAVRLARWRRPAVRAPARAAARAMRCTSCREESDPRDGQLWTPEGPGWRHRCGGLGVWL